MSCIIVTNCNINWGFSWSLVPQSPLQSSGMITAISSAVGKLWVLWFCCKFTCSLIVISSCSSQYGLATQNMFRVMWKYLGSNRINLFALMKLIPHLLTLLLNKKTNTLLWGSFNWSTDFCHFEIDVVLSRWKYSYPVQGMRGRKRLYLWVFSLAF